MALERRQLSVSEQFKKVDNSGDDDDYVVVGWL